MLSFNPLSSYPLSSILSPDVAPFAFPMLAGMNNQGVGVLTLMGIDAVDLLNPMSNVMALLEGFTEQTITLTGTMTSAPLDESGDF